MKPVRSLPIRVAPLPGEAIDSWLEAMASRLSVSWGEMLDALDLPVGGGGFPRWTVNPSREQLGNISKASGVSGSQLQGMVLRGYNDRALVLDGTGLRQVASSPWTRRSGSRFCPECFLQSGGRWQLAWRLGWAFACAKHHCLLADTCPACGVVPRSRTLPSFVTPQPGRCSNAPTNKRADRRRRSERCSADLTGVPVGQLPVEHPVLAAQRRIDSVISSGYGRFGVYQNDPQPALRVLADIRVLAHRVLTYSSRVDLRRHLPPNTPLPHEEPKVQVGEGYQRLKSVGADRPTTAAATAAGVVAALDILNHATVEDASAQLQWVIECCRRAEATTSPTAVLHWGVGTTEVLDAVRLAALAPKMLLSDQLRFRTVTALPRRTSSARSAKLNQRTPSLLWPRWAQPLAVPGSRRRHHRLALAATIQLIGTGQTPTEACAHMGGHLRPAELHRVLKLIHCKGIWRDCGIALARMADLIADGHAPIDYARRRHLDYTDLLPDDEWQRIYRRADAPAIGIRTAVAARMFLYERMSGQPAARQSSRAAFKVFSFPRCLTPNLLAELEQHGLEFLVSQGVTDEPVTWDPPPGVFEGLSLPAPDFDSIDRTQLFELLRTAPERRSMSAVAAILGITNDVLYEHLSGDPLPPRPPDSQYLINAQGHHFRAAGEMLTRERLTAMYRDEGLSIREIANRTQLSRQTVRHLADEYRVRMRGRSRRDPINVDPDWVKAQYLSELRTFPDIAAEVGVSASGLARWARRNDIQRPGQGNHNHAATLNARRRARSAPPLLKSAMAEIGGWERLQRFTRVADFSSLDLAAKAIGTTPCTLSCQIGRLERETGGALIRRATRAQPMKLTEHGVAVRKAIMELDNVSAI